MRRTLTYALAAIALIPTGALAQEWSAAQKEVWQVEMGCWQTRTAASFDACFHTNFVGWGINSTVPTTKADRQPSNARSLSTEDQVFLYLKPINITVRGEMAVLQYIATYTMKNKASGEETTTTERWTDIMIRDAGKWSWIADHGMELQNN